MSFFGVLGAVTGAAIGGITGGWSLLPMAVGAGMGSQVGGGVDSYYMNQANANYASAYASRNANYAQQYAEYNAENVWQSALWNSMLSLMSGKITADNTLAIATYNAKVQQAIAAYNSKLLRDEAALVYKKLDLDEYQFDRQVRKLVGAQRAAYSVSGVMIDHPGDTPELVEVDTRTEAELEKTVMRFNADVQAKKLLDAASLSEWKGKLIASQIMEEGKMYAENTTLRSMFSSFGTLITGKLRSNMIRWGGESQASTLLTEGAWRSSQFKQASWQSLVDGIFSGANIGVAAWSKFHVPQATILTGNDLNTVNSLNWGRVGM